MTLKPQRQKGNIKLIENAILFPIGPIGPDELPLLARIQPYLFRKSYYYKEAWLGLAWLGGEPGWWVGEGGLGGAGVIGAAGAGGGRRRDLAPGFHGFERHSLTHLV